MGGGLAATATLLLLGTAGHRAVHAARRNAAAKDFLEPPGDPPILLSFGVVTDLQTADIPDGD